MFRKVCIVGVGLIGGSLGEALKRKRLAREVVGIARHAASISLAKRRKAIDSGGISLSLVKGADLVVLASPVSVILKQAPQIAGLIGPDTIVIDVGSTKAEIVNTYTRITPRFVGCHPLAGSEQRGVKHARGDLFAQSLCVITPTRRTSAKARAAVERLWRGLGARVIHLTPARHDAVLGIVSHLPHAAAFALMNSVPAAYTAFSAGGLKDSTRIAAADAGLWTDIFMSNAKEVAAAMRRFKKECALIESAVTRGDRAALESLLKKAAVKRRAL